METGQHSSQSGSLPVLPPVMERVQHLTRAAARRASNIEVNPQTKQNLQGLVINFVLILICLLFIYILVLLL
ncbi:cardiac phospholamban-like [Arapaima gigas]